MCPIWGTCPRCTKLQVERMLRRAGRFVLKLQKYDTVKHEMSTELKWLFPDYVYQYELLNLAYSIFKKAVRLTSTII